MDSKNFPANKKLSQIKKINASLKDAMKSCSICPRKCKVDRTKGKKGYCRAPLGPVVYSYSSHRGEEPPLSGTRGSGTIFFSHCNMKCAYCQNYYFSQLDNGEEVSIERLSKMMLSLQKMGCHNINLVSPTHFVPQILSAMEKAFEEGLSIPIVYNTSGYELPDTVRLLDGIIDIYLPDMRYADNEMAKKYSDAPDYVEYNRGSVKEMQAQVGDLILDEAGIARAGLIIRLLALPDDISGTNATLKFIKADISQNAYLSIMSQYYPTYKAYNYKELSRGVTVTEYKNVVDEAKKLGLNNGWTQETPAELGTRFLGTNIKPSDKQI
jgi:putative pyruvate formate lyase activating enzyme